MKTSVAVCTYNGEKFLNQQLDSILNQTMPVDEIIVCDDRSSDATAAVLQSYAEKHPGIFKIYINEENIGSVRNFEKAVSLCKNEIIFFSDQDDVWAENKVERIVDTFNLYPEISVICTNGFGIDAQNKQLDVITVWDSPAFVKENKYQFDYFNILNLVDNFCTGATMAMKKEMQREIIPFPIMDGFHHDRWIALVSALRNKLFFLDEKLIYYREHSSQQVGNVLYKNTVDVKDSLTSYFSVEKEDKSFKDYKKLLKRFASAYKKNTELLKEIPDNKSFFENNLSEIKARFMRLENEMKKKHPVKSMILKIADNFKGKRKI
ncbi:MAG: glycosyltransferase family 2 protein [Weeksellaceae bacterium]|nr:glycosyltransferase family 2 protein [Bacteroidota bacterium]MCG2779364.1 glycosyltransferase family 2 protein [Weeksellaceae bacterium]